MNFQLSLGWSMVQLGVRSLVKLITNKVDIISS